MTAQEEGRSAPDLLAQEPVGSGMPTPGELVLDALRRESEALLTECTDGQNLAVWVDDDERAFDVKVIDIQKVATIQLEDGGIKEVLLHELQPRQDAAQAARSGATPEELSSQPRGFKVGDEVRWCWSGANADGTWFKARLTEEHPANYPKGWAGEITDCGTAYTAEHMGEVPLGFHVYMDIPSMTLVPAPSPSLRKEGGDTTPRVFRKFHLGDAVEPNDVDHLRDDEGDVWERRDTGKWHCLNDTAWPPLYFQRLLHDFGPLTEVLPSVSTQEETKEGETDG